MRLPGKRTLALLAALAAAASSGAQIFGITYDTGDIYEIDPTNAAVTYVDNSGVANVADLVVGEDGLVYGYTTGSNAKLYKFDPTKQWQGTLVGALGAGFFYEGALAMSSGGTVYGANSGSTTNDHLFKLNLKTGAATIGPRLTGNRDFNGFDFRADGKLVGIDRVSNALDTIDVNTGAVNQVAALAPMLGEVGGMTTFDVTTYFCSSGPGGVLPGNNSLYQINEQTGATSLIGAFGPTITGHGFSGLVSVFNTPEPGSFVALGGLLAFAGFGRRQRKGIDASGGRTTK